MSRIKEIYAYRTMISSLVTRDLKGRYKGAVLGFLWTFINPLLQMLVYTLVFSIIMRNGIEDFYMFLFVALIPWMFFSASLNGSATCILSQKEMVNKIYFPREVLPISFVTSQFINMLLSFIVVFLVMFIGGYVFNPRAIACLPIVMIVEYILALGFSMILSALTVFFRDLEYVLSIATMLWQYLTPVIYSIDIVPEKYRRFFALNPMTYVIVSYRDILYYGRVPKLSNLISTIVIGLITLSVGWCAFYNLQKHFAEEL
ncbi:MAG: ABC transporter permease [Butyrivibrio sp.]|nr:ABC transporter permease [Butyrivibrio sp.]